MQGFKFIIAAAVLVASPLVSAAEHSVKLLTSGAGGQTMVMEPAYIKIAAGDTINFSPSDTSHNAQSVSTPVGAEAFETPMGQTVTVTFDQEGVYIYKCLPHLALGMVGVVQVGEAVNLEAAKKDGEALSAMIYMNKEQLTEALAQIK